MNNLCINAAPAVAVATTTINNFMQAQILTGNHFLKYWMIFKIDYSVATALVVLLHS